MRWQTARVSTEQVHCKVVCPKDDQEQGAAAAASLYLEFVYIFQVQEAVEGELSCFSQQQPNRTTYEQIHPYCPCF